MAGFLLTFSAGPEIYHLDCYPEIPCPAKPAGTRFTAAHPAPWAIGRAMHQIAASKCCSTPSKPD